MNIHNVPFLNLRGKAKQYYSEYSQRERMQNELAHGHKSGTDTPQTQQSGVFLNTLENLIKLSRKLSIVNT